MKNLKKVLALVVAVAMLASFGFTASAASYSDVASTASYADAVNLLSNLGIITGFEDGTFRPTETVTRAQAATMIVRMRGLADGVEQGATSFTDVAADHWASGYINVAVANGIVNGMGDGTFRPEGEVTYGQIVKMIVCAIGYGPMAENNGGYNGGGYIVAGSKAGFTKGVSGTADAAASRATVAQLIYNALEVDLMDQTSYSTGIYGDTYEILEGKTILSEYLELEKVEGIVLSTPLSDAEVALDEDAVAEIVITKNFAEEDEANYEVGTSVTFIADGVDTAALLGYAVVAYVGENEDGDDEVFAIAEKAGKNSVTVIDTELIEEFDETGVVYFKTATSKKTTEALLDTVITFKGADDFDVENFVIVNGFNVNYMDMENVLLAVETLEEVSFLDNDGDGDFEFVIATIPSDNAVEFVVDEIDDEDYDLVAKGNGEGLNLYDYYDDETKKVTIVKDGHVVDFDAIEEGDVVTVLDNSLNIVTVYVSSTVVEGVVDEIDDDVFTINGKDYKVSGLSADVTVDDIDAGDEGYYYITATGKITYVETVNSIAGANYVYVIAADEKLGDFGENEYLVKVVNAKGAVEVLTIKNKKVDVFTEDGETSDLEDAEVYEFFADYEGLAKIETNASGEISVVYFPGAEDFAVVDTYADENEKEFSEKKSAYGRVEIGANTLVFNKDTNEEDLEDAITVINALDLFVDGSSYQFTAYGEDDFDVADVLVATDAKTAFDAEAPVMVVTKVAKTTSDDESTYKITGLVAGETVSVIVDPDEASDADDVEKGNIIAYAVNGGYATDLVVLLASNVDGVDANTLQGNDYISTVSSDEMVDIAFGLVVEKTAKYFYIGDVVDEDTSESLSYGAAADGCNYTIVEYAGTGITVKAGTATAIKASEKNPVYVFIKTVEDAEDEVSDVVIFKGLN